LNRDEIDTLNRLVVIFLETAELRAKNRMDITIKFWRENVDKLLLFQEKPVLSGKGKISNKALEEHVRNLYDSFNKKRKMYDAKKADKDDLKELKLLEETIKNKLSKPYPKYKDSSIEWIGKIPEHWDVEQLKWNTTFEYGVSLSSEARKDGDIPVFGSNGITGFHDAAITKSPCLIIGRKGSFGKVNWSDKECFPIDTTYYVDQTKTINNLRWLYYILLNLRLDQFSRDTGVPGLNREDAYQNFYPYLQSPSKPLSLLSSTVKLRK